MKEFTDGAGSGFITALKLSQHGRTFPFSHWMPPHDFEERSFAQGEKGLREWRNYYSRALDAVKFCCENPDAEYNGVRICGEKRFQGKTAALIKHSHKLGTH